MKVSPHRRYNVATLRAGALRPTATRRLDT
nr:MAG TPA: hypothetical protein [Caudoviricetes sp.]